MSPVFNDMGKPQKIWKFIHPINKILADFPIFQALHFNIAGSVFRGKTAGLHNLSIYRNLCINNDMC